MFLGWQSGIRNPSRSRTQSRADASVCRVHVLDSMVGSANRVDDHISYTNNWPFEPLVGNRPTGESVMWTGVSIIMLLAGICAMVWWYAAQKPKSFPLHFRTTIPWELGATPSQRATLKYFWVVSALILVQIVMGDRHGALWRGRRRFLWFQDRQWLALRRGPTWHVQLGIFWIATAWLAAGLFIGPLVSGNEPKFQRLGVHVLFGALLVMVVGSMTGEWLSVQNRCPTPTLSSGAIRAMNTSISDASGKFFIRRLLIWLFLVVRAIRPALKTKASTSRFSGSLFSPRARSDSFTERV